MNLIQLVTAGFKRAGVIAYNLQQAINTKQDKLPTNGTAGQFLAHDLTFKTPSGGSSGTTLTWTDLTLAAGNNFASGFADGSNKLQIAKDASGYIWMRGVIRNLLTSGGNTATILVFPSAYRLRLASNTAGVDSLLPVPVVNLNAKGTTGPIFLSPYTYDTSTQWLSQGYGAIVGNAVLYIAPSIIGIALNP